MLPNQAKQDEEVERISKVFLHEHPSFQKRWDLQDKGYNYLRSIQYTPQQIAYYEGQRRPTNVFNAIFEKFNHVLGNHFLNDQRQRVLKKAGGTAEVAQIWEDIMNHVHTQNDYRAEMGRTLLAGWIGGGFIYPRYSNEMQMDGSLVYRNEDEYDVIWDSRARNYFLDDAMYMQRSRWMSTSNILNERAWSGRKSKLKEILIEIEKSDFDWPHDDEGWRASNASDPTFVDRKNGLYRIAEFHEIVWDYAETVTDPKTQESNILSIQDPRRRDTYLKANPNLILTEQRARVKNITSIIPGLNFFLDTHPADTQDGTYDIIPYFPYPYGKYVTQYFGLMQVLLGPQDFLNEMKNRTTDIMNKTANATLEVILDAYDNPEDVKNVSNEPGFVALKKEKYRGQKTMERHDPPVLAFDSEAMSREALLFIDLLTTTENQMGRRETTNEPASLYAQRVAQAQIKFAVPTYWLNSVKTRLNNKLIKLGQSNYNTERMLMITDPDNQDQRQLYINIQAGDEILNNVQLGEYEVHVDDTNKNPGALIVRNERKRLFAEWLFQIFGPNAFAVIDWDWLLTDSDLGDMNKQIERIKMYVEMMTGMGEKTAAMEDMNALLDTVQKNVNLQSAGTPATGAGPVSDKKQGTPTQQRPLR